MPFFPLDPEVAMHFLRGSNGGKTKRGFIAVIDCAPAAAAAANVLALTAQPAAGTTVVTSGITNPDVPRVLSITGNQATCTGNVVIDGTDANDQVIQDTIALSGTSTVAGAKAFKTVTQVTIPTRGAANDQVSVGVTKTIGLFHKVPTAQHVLKTIFNGAADAGTFAVHATEVARNTYAIAGTPNGTLRLYVAYLVHH